MPIVAPKNDAFDDAVEQVPVLDELLRVGPVVVLVDAQELHAVERAADDAHEDRP